MCWVPAKMLTAHYADTSSTLQRKQHSVAYYIAIFVCYAEQVSPACLPMIRGIYHLLHVHACTMAKMRSEMINALRRAAAELSSVTHGLVVWHGQLLRPIDAISNEHRRNLLSFLTAQMAYGRLQQLQTAGPIICDMRTSCKPPVARAEVCHRGSTVLSYCFAVWG